MVLLDIILTILTPIASILVSYLLLQYLPTRASRKLNLKRLNEASETFKKFRRDLKKGTTGPKKIALTTITVISIYISLFTIQYYHANENIVYVPMILIFIGELELIAINTIKKCKADPMFAYDLKTNSNLVLADSIFAWLMLFIYNYNTTPTSSIPEFILGFILVAGGLMAVAILISLLVKTSDLENLIFQSKYNNKVSVECITKSGLTSKGKIIGIGQFLLLKSNRCVQVIRWHDIQEMALLSDR